MVTVTCDRLGCGNSTTAMVRDDSPLMAYPPRHYYAVQHRGEMRHFCSARCLLPWVELSIPVDDASAGVIESARGKGR